MESWSEATGWDGCLLTSCLAGYHPASGLCASDTLRCTVAGDGVTTNDGEGLRYWSGTDYGACTLTGCGPSDTAYSGACYPSQRDCSNSDGMGFSTFVDGSYLGCTLTYCYNPYLQPSGSACLLPSGSYCNDNGECASGFCAFTLFGPGCL